MRFPDLYASSVEHGAWVGDMGSHANGLWTWGELGIQSQDLPVIVQRLHLLKSALFHFCPTEGTTDTLLWYSVEGLSYTVKLKNDNIVNSKYHDLLEDGHDSSFVKLWSAHIQARIKAFRWRFLWNGLPKKEHLKIRGLCLSSNEGLCVFCSQEEEELNGLFFYCPFVLRVWDKVGEWIDLLKGFIGPSWKQYLGWCSL